MQPSPQLEKLLQDMAQQDSDGMNATLDKFNAWRAKAPDVLAFLKAVVGTYNDAAPQRKLLVSLQGDPESTHVDSKVSIELTFETKGLPYGWDGRWLNESGAKLLLYPQPNGDVLILFVGFTLDMRGPMQWEEPKSKVYRRYAPDNIDEAAMNDAVDRFLFFAADTTAIHGKGGGAHELGF